MDYKEKYEQALERARQFSDKPYLEDSAGIVEYIFPELAESEDERIRKALVEMVHDTTGDSLWIDYNVHKEDALAWLEKQCEKTEPIEYFDTEFERQVSHLVASIINKEYSYTKDFVKWTSDALLNYAKHEIEKQVEQKLYVNDNAKEMFIKALECVEEQNNKGYKLTDCDKNSWWEDFKVYTTSEQIPANSAKTCKDEQKPVDFSDLRTWKYIVDAVWTEKEGIGQYLDSPFTEEVAKKLQKRFGKIEQKPAEWTADDEEELKIALNTLEEAGQYSSAKWLKNVCLVPQTMQKHSWSEEDENHVKSILSTIECCKAQFPNAQAMVEAYNADIEWLKSLRTQNTCKPSGLPHWKKSTFPNGNTTGFNSDYFCHNGYCINYKELFEKLPKDD